MYIDSGVFQILRNFGIKFTEENFIENLMKFMKTITFLQKMSNYPFSAERMCSDYLNLL